MVSICITRLNIKKFALFARSVYLSWFSQYTITEFHSALTDLYF
jgi:hypothetical protein